MNYYYLVQQIDNITTHDFILFYSMKDVIEYSFPIFDSKKTYLTHTEDTNEYFLKSPDNENIIFFILEINNFLI